MKLLALVTDAFGGKGGIARYNQELFTQLAALDTVQKIVILPQFADPETGRLPDKVIQLKAEPNKITFALRALQILYSRGPFDGIYCGQINLTPVAAFLAKFYRIPLWLQIYGVEAWQSPKKFLVRWACRNLLNVTSLSRVSRERFLNWSNVSPERVRIIPAALEPRFSPGPKTEFLREHFKVSGRPVLLTVSRLSNSPTDRYKGHDRVIETLPDLVKKFPDIVYVIVGEGPDRARLENLAKSLGVCDRVKFLGFLHSGSREMVELYRSVDLYVMPSRGEGFGIVYLEAMGCGIPVVAGDSDASRDPLQDGNFGILASDKNLAESIEAALGRSPVPSKELAERVHFVFSLGHFREQIRLFLESLVPLPKVPGSNEPGTFGRGTRPTRPRVMQIITRLIWGGAQEVTVLIVKRLLKEGYEVVFAHGPGDESLLKLLPRDNPNLELLYIPEFRRRILPFQDLGAFVRLWCYLKKHPVDLVHTHTSKAGIIGRWAAHLAGIKVIVHSPRGSIYHETYFREGTLRFFAWLERITSKFTAKIITLCESEKRDYIRYRIAPPEKFTTIYSGVEVKRFTDIRVDIPKRKAELGILSNAKVIGYVARMTPEKGHTLCLEAFRKVREKISDAVLVLVGGGPLEEVVRNAVESMGLKNSVIMTGFRKDIPEIVLVFDCCVQTSLWDGLPRAMVETMLGEKAMVATSVGGIPEVIHDQRTGILVPEKDVNAIANGIIDLLTHPEKTAELGRNARRRMEEVFDIDISVEKLFTLYEAMIQWAVKK